MVVDQQTFEEAVAEFIQKTDELLGQESQEDLPPPPPSPLPQAGPPVGSLLMLDAQRIREYAYTIGDDNPLYTDPEYGRTSIYGSQIAPGPILSVVRYPSVHGVQRPQGYPVANYISGNAWEFFDVIRVGSRFSSSKVPRESFEKQGAHGRLLFLISEVRYWDQAGEMKGKAYATQIHVPMEQMGSGRSMSVDKLGQTMLYERDTHRYSAEEADEIARAIASEQRRGAEPRYWEDVEVGDELPPITLPPFTLQDIIAFRNNGYGLTAGWDGSRAMHAFEPVYQAGKQKPDAVRTHPLTRWPFTPGTEHEDALMARYIGFPGAFDFGIQRAQIPQRLIANWAGDHGFLRKMYIAFRRPVFYGDMTRYHGTVIKKYSVAESGEAGGVEGEATYHAVTIEIKGVNQIGETPAPGFATVYLPSREHGPVRLPVPHPAEPPFVPFETHRRAEWY